MRIFLWNITNAILTTAILVCILSALARFQELLAMVMVPALCPWGKEWLVLTFHYKSIMWHLYKQHERSVLSLVHIRSLLLLPRLRWEDSPRCPRCKPKQRLWEQPRVEPSAAERWHGLKTTGLCWWEGTPEQTVRLKAFYLQCHTTGKRLQPLKTTLILT